MRWSSYKSRFTSDPSIVPDPYILVLGPSNQIPAPKIVAQVDAQHWFDTQILQVWFLEPPPNLKGSRFFHQKCPSPQQLLEPLPLLPSPFHGLNLHCRSLHHWVRGIEEAQHRGARGRRSRDGLRYLRYGVGFQMQLDLSSMAVVSHDLSHYDYWYNLI